MHGAVQIRTARWGTACLAWPRLGGYRDWLSPNCTPWASTLMIGGSQMPDERRMVRVRRALWGHGYDSERLDPQILDHAVWAAESRHPSAVAQFGTIVAERAEWLAAVSK